MADVWFAKDTLDAGRRAATTPALSDLLAAPATDLLPGGEVSHAAPVHATGDHAAVAMIHARLLDEDEARRNTPLL